MKNGSTTGMADIVIPVRNQFPRTRTLLESIYRFSDQPFHIHLIDNASSDGTMDVEKVYSRDITVVHNPDDRGWGVAVDQGVALGSGPYVVVMSNEVEVAPGWLGSLLSFLDTHPRIGAVVPLSSGASDVQGVEKVRRTQVPEIPEFLTEDPHERNRVLAYHFFRTGVLLDGVLSFFCAALRRRVIEEIGPFQFGTAAGDHGEEYCRRLRRARYVIGLALDTYVVHHRAEDQKNVLPAGHQPELRPHSFPRLRRRTSLHLAAARH
jgi:GT2 family glycosyltransferase